MRTKRSIIVFSIVVVASMLFLFSVQKPDTAAYARNETLYTSGTQWGPPSSWNPFNSGGYAMGTVGLCYETLFLFDPLTNQYTPWLATAGTWGTGANARVFTVTLRSGVNWSDGHPFTADDVVATFQLGRTAPISLAGVWQQGLQSVTKVNNTTVTFTFTNVLYQSWYNTLYNTPIVPASIWASRSANDIVSGANANPIGTGPYLYETSDQSRMVWVKNPNWWARTALNLDPRPRRIVDIVNGSNNVALGMVLQGQLDLSNNFLPGVASLVAGGYGVSTYYPQAPYMMSANTAWVLMNLTKKPMDDPSFRRAFAFCINTDQIVNSVYGNIVMKANPTGLLPIWDAYVDQSVVTQRGFSYDPAQARTLLAAAGYRDINNDGFVEAPDRSAIALTIAVPNGWSDWMGAINVIAQSARAVGINLTTQFPDYGQYIERRNAATFDMMIANDVQMSNTPWTYYYWMFQHPLANIATLQNGNYGRYNNQRAFDLVDQLNTVNVTDTAGMRAIISQLQTIQLTDMPLIPLWYNGLWSQVSNAVWTGWPSSTGANHFLPCTWRGYWNMTGIKMLCALTPAPAQ